MPKDPAKKAPCGNVATTLQSGRNQKATLPQGASWQKPNGNVVATLPQGALLAHYGLTIIW